MAGFLEKRRERKQAEQEVLAYAEQALADDIITEEEETKLVELVERVQGDAVVTPQSKFYEIGRRVLIAKANAGQLPEVEAPKLMAKPGEIVHAEAVASLMKEVTLSHREYVGGGSGVSIRVAKGVRVHTGGGRGHSYTVVDGTALRPDDSGILSVTSQRLVYLGGRKTFEVPYAKLVQLSVYSDGISVSATNRQRTLLFSGFDGPVVAAYINAAAGAVQ